VSSVSSAVEVKPHSRQRSVVKRGQSSILGGDGLPQIECSRREMLSVLTKTFRAKAAIVLAALYLLCILAPSAAFAFSANPGVAHCLTEGHVGVHDHGGKVHVHADGTAHHHDHDGAASPSGDDEKSRVATCCSLFSVVAIAGEPGLSLGLYSPASTVVPVLADDLSGRGPERINRPPISPLSF
jgi:hypothetical protein